MVEALVGIQDSLEEQNALRAEAMREDQEFRERQRVGTLALKRAVDGVRDELRNYLHEQEWKTDSRASEQPVETSENRVIVPGVESQGEGDLRAEIQGAAEKSREEREMEEICNIIKS
jgi:hypothetical protein